MVLFGNRLISRALIVFAIVVSCQQGLSEASRRHPHRPPHHNHHHHRPWGSQGFVQTRGTQFVVNGKPMYLNGFNSYWMMIQASNPSTRGMVTSAFQQASKYKMNVARAWAFSDGGPTPLQTAPGSYNEAMFKGLDYVISEAKKNGVYLILSLVNNYQDFGGRFQYVNWASERGQRITNEDDFYVNPVVKTYYRNHVKAVLTRINSITGVAYKDDPTIFAWELMNEPRCQSDLSGRSVQNWVSEMAAHVKSIDPNHLVEVGLEGFYGESMPEKKQNNPGYGVGTDFITNNQVPWIDFATIHLYPEQHTFLTLHSTSSIVHSHPSLNQLHLYHHYRLTGSNEESQAVFVDKWIQAHTDDSDSILRKPLLVSEFGKSSKLPGYTVAKRDGYFSHLFDTIYASARSHGACAGGLFWQLMAPGMESWADGYEVVLEDSPSTGNVIAQQSNKLALLT